MSAVLCCCWNEANVPYLLHFLRWFWFHTILNMQKAEVVRVYWWHFSDTCLMHVRNFIWLLNRKWYWCGFIFLSKMPFIITSISAIKSSQERGKNALFCEYISRLSSFTVYHSVIQFCSNSIKLIVFLGNYPQPPAGQISIHDLNNAH